MSEKAEETVSYEIQSIDEELSARLIEAYETVRKVCAMMNCPDCPLYGRWGCLCDSEGSEPYHWPKFADKKPPRW